jgi:hypothetical protein
MTFLWSMSVDPGGEEPRTQESCDAHASRRAIFGSRGHHQPEVKPAGDSGRNAVSQPSNLACETGGRGCLKRLSIGKAQLRVVLWLSFIPGVLAVLAFLLIVREPQESPNPLTRPSEARARTAETVVDA